MGARYLSVTVCKHCGFRLLHTTETAWRSCDFEKDYVTRDKCSFCAHIAQIDLPALFPELLTYDLTALVTREKLIERFPGQTVSAAEEYWYNGASKNRYSKYIIAFNFTATSCSIRNGRSFEDCLEQIEEEIASTNTDVNKLLTRNSILFRKFD
jgi:hypothetical protein